MSPARKIACGFILVSLLVPTEADTAVAVPAVPAALEALAVTAVSLGIISQERAQKLIGGPRTQVIAPETGLSDRELIGLVVQMLPALSLHMANPQNCTKEERRAARAAADPCTNAPDYDKCCQDLVNGVIEKAKESIRRIYCKEAVITPNNTGVGYTIQPPDAVPGNEANSVRVRGPRMHTLRTCGYIRMRDKNGDYTDTEGKKASGGTPKELNEKTHFDIWEKVTFPWEAVVGSLCK